MNEKEQNRYSPPTAPLPEQERSLDTPARAIGVRFLATLLMLGGVCGIALTMYLGLSSLGQQQWISVILVLAFLALFAWSTLAGFRLWRGDPRGVKWSKILFAMQIPV